MDYGIVCPENQSAVNAAELMHVGGYLEATFEATLDPQLWVLLETMGACTRQRYLLRRHSTRYSGYRSTLESNVVHYTNVQRAALIADRKRRRRKEYGQEVYCWYPISAQKNCFCRYGRGPKGS